MALPGQNGGMKMLARSLTGLLAVAVLLAPHAARAAESPILVSDCRGGIASISLNEIGAYDVSFRNTSDVAADEIRFAIPYGHQNVAIYDIKGRFQPRADMKKALRKQVGPGAFTSESAKNTCNVQYVHFVNGTTWRRRPAQGGP
jgi:hypothetical protein